MVWWVLGPLTLMPAMMGLGFVYHRGENCVLLRTNDEQVARQSSLKAV